MENSFDPDSPPRRRGGVGLANVRQRLATRHGNLASFDAKTEGDRYRVAITMPAERPERAPMTQATEKKFRAVIVDDEELARQVLREFLTAHPEIEIAAECANGFEAVKSVTELKPDLVFLDVQMPKLDGFEVLELIGTSAAVVFVTAHDNYAIRAFEVHAVDYLLKPFGCDRFEAALTRAKDRLSSASSAAMFAQRAASTSSALTLRPRRRRPPPSSTSRSHSRPRRHQSFHHSRSPSSTTPKPRTTTSPSARTAKST